MPWPILIVEDDAELRDALAEMLAAHGYRLHTAPNGEEALRLLTRRVVRPAVIVLDMMMPVMDGSEFLRKTSADPALSAIPTVVLSAQPQHASSFPPAVVAVMPKPLDLPRLLAVVQGACGRVLSSSAVPPPRAPEPSVPTVKPTPPAETDRTDALAAAAPADVQAIDDPPVGE